MNNDEHNDELDDPFPISLPHILDTNMTVMGDFTFDIGTIYGKTQMYSSPSYQDPPRAKARDVANYSSHETMSNESPDSFPDSWSSGSSHLQHKRNDSAESSQSGLLEDDGDAAMKMSYSPLPKGIAVGAYAIADQASRERSPSTDLDASNKAMESTFDFESAASNSNAEPDVSQISSTLNEMPPRSVKNNKPYHQSGTYHGRLKSSRDTSPLNIIQNRGGWGGWPDTAQQSQRSFIHASDTHVNGAIFEKLPDRPVDVPPALSRVPETTSIETSNFQFQPMMATSLDLFPSAYDISDRPKLLVEGVPYLKSRVETQIRLKLKLTSLPQGVTKLHLQSHTIAKAKYVARPTPEKSPEMLELHAMVVCTSAIQDQAKRAQAFARAAGTYPVLPTAGRYSSSNGSVSPLTDEEQPANGGPVQICRGCLERERKRSNRKKPPKDQQMSVLEQEWQKDEAKRIVVFNCVEVRDWDKPGTRETERKKGQSTSPSIDKTAVVDLPMRITCYCRHHEEKVGFQVIFTLKDHRDIVLTQGLSNPIMITDDHKTQVNPNGGPTLNTAFPPGVVIESANAFPRAPIHDQGLAFQQNYNDQIMQPQYHTQSMDSYAMPQATSGMTSMTLTPKSLSRPASPSGLSGQQHKRRKATSSGRVRPNDLAMTKLETPSGGAAADNEVSSFNQYIESGPAGALGFAPHWAPPVGPQQQSGPSVQQTPRQYNTNPSTPNTADHARFSPSLRSHSMDDLQGFSSAVSASNSMRPSRVPSPNSGLQSHGMSPINPQMLANSLHSASNASQPNQSYQPPVIYKLIPAEGSKSGGFEVTCLGRGFHQGLEVMFGDRQATTTTFWGSEVLCCLVPPALRAGPVPVVFKGDYEQRWSRPHPNKLAIFKYIDDEEQELMKHALALVNSRFNNGINDPAGSARSIINMFGTNASFTDGFVPNMGPHQSNNQRAAQGPDTLNTGRMDLETATLSCLHLVDLDDSPRQVNLNAQGSNGQSMLHLSASLGLYRLSAGLLARGANPDIRDKNGLSPMHMAALRDHPRTIRKLRSAGADPTLRTLNGFTPADMATSQEAYEASNALDHHTRPNSAVATPMSHLSRANSAISSKSSREAQARAAPAECRRCAIEDGAFGNEVIGGAHRSQPETPAQMYTQSKRSSLAPDQEYASKEPQGEGSAYASMFAANSAMSAWRDQLAAQIQQIQQSMNLTMPNLPIPNLPDYQVYPMVRKISQMVPQRRPTPSTAGVGPGIPKESEHHWWELRPWQSTSPPAYEDIYPQNLTNDEKPSIPGIAEEPIWGRMRGGEGETSRDDAESSSVIETVDLGNSSLTQNQREQLRATHARKMKRLRSDRNLFLIWIPLLVLVLGAILKDRIPPIVEGVRLALGYVY